MSQENISKMWEFYITNGYLEGIYYVKISENFFFILWINVNYMVD